MPKLGESVVEGTVMRWLVQEGGVVKEFDPLLEVNTDKVDTEIPSDASGTVLKILVPEGTTVKAGATLAWIGEPGEAIPESDEPAPQEAAAAEPAQAPPPPAPAAQTEAAAAPVPQPQRDLGFVSPVVAKIAREKNVDLGRVEGSGEGGRITKRDVLAYVEKSSQAALSAAAKAEVEPAAWETPGEGDLFRPTELMFKTPPGTEKPPAPPAEKPAAPTPPPAQATGDRIVPLSYVRKLTAKYMLASKQTSPHVTSVMEADFSRVTAHRAANKAKFEQDGVNLTYTAYFVAAVVDALRANPMVNSSWTDQGLLIHGNINVGIAVSLGDEGLIVPVIKGADGLSLLGIARAVNDLAQRARAQKLAPDEIKDGTFTITNHGTSGSLFATPIINQPQSAILGVGAIQKRAVVIDDAIAIRPMVYVSITFDHRILDGSGADKFLKHVVDVLQNWA